MDYWISFQFHYTIPERRILTVRRLYILDYFLNKLIWHRDFGVEFQNMLSEGISVFDLIVLFISNQQGQDFLDVAQETALLLRQVSTFLAAFYCQDQYFVDYRVLVKRIFIQKAR